MGERKFKLISARNVLEYISRPDIFFIDLRSREEFKEGHIGRAFCLSIEQIKEEDYCLIREYGYILYCNHGGVSMQAAALLANGEVPIYTLVGGMEEYDIFMRSLVDRKQGKL